jgi:N-carbamoyl-L-amino-acid hydrolase
MSAVKPDVKLGREFLDELLRVSSDGAGGVMRIAYGSGEQEAHYTLTGFGERCGLPVERDFAGNTYVRLKGRDRSAKCVVIGSHLDAVPHGGNYDGALGVAAGLAAIAGVAASGQTLERDVLVMGVRAEESCFFPAAYIGSRMALGTLPRELFDSLKRSDTGRPLADHMRELGCDPHAVQEGKKFLSADQVACYLEVHIEQGPVLENEGMALGVVQAITGGPRWRDGRIHGVYAHAGGAPKGYRQDAVAALGEFIYQINRLWDRFEKEGHYTLFTFGIIGTDPAMHTYSRVPGEARFCLDTRCIDENIRTRIGEEIRTIAESISTRHGVRFEWGPDSGPNISPLAEHLQQGLCASAKRFDIPYKLMASGAGHDASAFADAGIPSGMLFVRNQNGSHNKDETMRMDDLESACTVMTDFLCTQFNAA